MRSIKSVSLNLHVISSSATSVAAVRKMTAFRLKHRIHREPTMQILRHLLTATSGRMQMYRFTGPTPGRDGDLDGNVVFHELTHGTSNRLIGNGSGLTSNRAGSSGEGWGDLFGFLLTAEGTDPVNGIYSTGAYVTYRCCGLSSFTTNYYHGIRRFPYAPIGFKGGPNNRPHNPLTLADIQTITATDGAYPCSTLIACTGSANEVHNAGEIWAVTGVEVWGQFAARLGSSVAALKTLQYLH